MCGYKVLCLWNVVLQLEYFSDTTETRAPQRKKENIFLKSPYGCRRVGKAVAVTFRGKTFKNLANNCSSHSRKLGII